MIPTIRHEIEAKAEAVLARAYLGIHHVPYWRRRQPSGNHGVKVTIQDGISSCDYDTLTRLVVAAHDECVRIEICSGGPRQLVIHLHPRVREGDITERHPTMEEAVVSARRSR